MNDPCGSPPSMSKWNFRRLSTALVSNLSTELSWGYLLWMFWFCGCTFMDSTLSIFNQEIASVVVLYQIESARADFWTHNSGSFWNDCWPLDTLGDHSGTVSEITRKSTTCTSRSWFYLEVHSDNDVVKMWKFNPAPPAVQEARHNQE